MDVAGAHGVVERLGSFDASAGDPAERTVLLADAERLRRWVDARAAILVRQVVAEVSFPELVVGEAQQVPFREAEQVVRRVQILDEVPTLAAALEDGRVSVRHVDVLDRIVRGLTAAEKRRLLAEVDGLIIVASKRDADGFARHVRKVCDRFRADDGMALLERQRRAARLQVWTDKVTGMWHVHGEFDPFTGAQLAAVLRARTESLFHDVHPATAPDDPLAKHLHLRALAFADLVLNGGAGARVEVVGVVDLSGAEVDEPVVIDWGLPFPVPVGALAGLPVPARFEVVIVGNGRVLSAPGVLDLGRSVRSASPAQRRALRAMYRGCSIPGCCVPFDDCKVHHLRWWRNGGRTDLANLLPVCVKHHHGIHDRGWVVSLGPDRSLTVRTPDGNVQTTGPPTRRATG